MSTEFKDSFGRSWTVALDFAAAKRVRGAVKVADEKGIEVPFDIIDAANIGLTMSVLKSKYSAVCETLYQICKPQADEKGVTEAQFLSGCYGDSLDEAAKVIEEELILFFPKSLREVLKLMFKKSDEIREKALAEAGSNLAEVTLENLNQSGQSHTKPQESLA
jgi:hypothetical protein